MRPFIAIVAMGLLASCLLADDDKNNTLTEKEKADGWVLLFDGKETKGWKVDGDAKVADGLLVVGGDKLAKIRTESTYGKFELRFEYRNGGKAKGFPLVMGMGLSGALGGKEDFWNEVTVTGEAKTIQGKDKVSDTFTILLKSQRKQEKTSIDFQVPAGGTISLRNIKFKTP